MGLLDGLAQPPAAPQPTSGLLGGMAQGGSADGLQMAQMLAQNPTPEMAQQIVAKMQAAGMPEAEQFAKVFAQAEGDPAMLKQIAEAAIQALSQ